MSQQELGMFEFFVKKNPIVQRLNLLRCPTGNVNISPNLFNTFRGHIAMTENVSRKKLDAHFHSTSLESTPWQRAVGQKHSSLCHSTNTLSL